MVPWARPQGRGGAEGAGQNAPPPCCVILSGGGGADGGNAVAELAWQTEAAAVVAARA